MAISAGQIHTLLGGIKFPNNLSNKNHHHHHSNGATNVFLRRSSGAASLFGLKKKRDSFVGPVKVVSKAKRDVGIDLGNTNSAVAAVMYPKKIPTILPNSQGQRITPSVVAYTDNGDILVGDAAKSQAAVNPDNTFHSVKRIIGKKMSELDEELKNKISYPLVEDDDGNIMIDCSAVGTQFTPQDISAQVLRKLVDDAALFLGERVTNVVVAVPPDFNDSQRAATKEAGSFAGITVMRIINEPTAAALAYGFAMDKATVLVFHLGGGTFHVSVLEVGDGVFEVLSTSGDTNLGGDDFDKRIVDWLALSFKRDEGIDLWKDRQALQRLTEAAGKAKMELSSLTQANISLPFITSTADGPKHIKTTLTRAKFEELCSDLFDRLKIPVENALKEAKVSYKDLDEVILVGGSTRIPAVQELVKKLTAKEPNVTINPDEAVALGAAIQADIMIGDDSDLEILGTSSSIGLETMDGVMTTFIPKYTSLPASKSQMFSTAADGQTSVKINVFQGESEFVRDNKFLGSFCFNGIRPAPRGVPQIEVTFYMDGVGLLSVAALDKGTGKRREITSTGANSAFNDEVERMAKEAEKYVEEDKEKKEAIDTKNQARLCCLPDGKAVPAVGR